jgi:hypothetical protein
MLRSRVSLAVAALALSGALAACADGGTAPQSRADDPLVQQLNRLAGGQGQVLQVKKNDRVQQGLPAGKADAPATANICTIDGGCEPRDFTCYSSCSWFDVDAYFSYGTSGGSKWVQLTGSLYAYSNAAFGDVFIDFYSVGGCSSTPSRFDGSYLSGSNGPFTLSASRYVEYTGGSFTWAVNSDGYAQNRYGRDGYESTYATLCF